MAGGVNDGEGGSHLAGRRRLRVRTLVSAEAVEGYLFLRATSCGDYTESTVSKIIFERCSFPHFSFIIRTGKYALLQLLDA